MFGFPSLQKLLVLAAIIAIVWYGFKFIGRLQEARDAQTKKPQRKPRWPGKRRSEPTAPEAEDMVQCPVCQAYVAARGAKHCGRADCPY